MTDDLVKRLRALGLAEANEAANMIERLNKENDSLVSEIDALLDGFARAKKARAEQKKEQRLIEFGSSVIAASVFGGVFLFGAWLHDDFDMGLAWLFTFFIFYLVGDLIFRAYKWASSWWKNRNDR